MPDTEQIIDEELKAKKTTAYMVIIKVTYYRGCPVYIRQIKEDMFVYDVIFDNQLYSSYIIAEPDKGKKKLTKKQILSATGLIFSGACTTIDSIIDRKKNELLSNAVETTKHNKNDKKRKKKLN